MSDLYHIWMDDTYVYTATTSGLYIINSDTEVQIAYVRHPQDPACITVTCDDDYVYMGTTASGVKRFSKSEISAGGNLYTSLTDYVEEPWIVSNRTIHMYSNDNNIILSTVSGINIIRKKSMYVSYTEVSGVTGKCFVTPNDYYYYTVSGANWTLNRLDGNSSDWTTPDEIYTAGEGFLSSASVIKDFYVTEHTSTIGNYNTLFVATDESVIVYDEGTGQYIKLYTTVS